MKLDFKNLMEKKSDQGLQEYLDKRTKFVPDAVEAAMDEMQKRGRVFTESELETYRKELQQQRELAQIEADEPSAPTLKRRGYTIMDENVPLFYSERAIYWFSILFSTFFGSVLLAINCWHTKSRKGVWEILLFGLTYTLIQTAVLSVIPPNSLAIIAFSMTGGMLLNYIFWNKYIGMETAYRARPIWVPLVIGIIICIPLVYAMLNGGVPTK